MKAVVSAGKGAGLAELSSRFYTIIPHNFGRMVPPVIRTLEEVQRKMEMLEVRVGSRTPFCLFRSLSFSLSLSLSLSLSRLLSQPLRAGARRH
jgi:hypothetical protein